jgi:hypothetical protein
MIVFDLKCSADHVFEAWFGSSSAYDDQRARGLIACPFCGASDVTKAVMAPNIPAKGNRAQEVLPATQPMASAPTAPAEVKAFLAAAAAVQAKMLEKSQWVGRSFAEKARAMDAGDVPHSIIHGEVTRDEAKALIDDGVAVTPLPFPVIDPAQQN